MEGGDDAQVPQHLDQAGNPTCGSDGAESRGKTDQRRVGGAPIAGTRDHDDTVFHKEVDADQTGRSRV